MTTYKIRTLCFQPTDHIVWASIESRPLAGYIFSDVRIPSSISPELEYRVYIGTLDNVTKFWQDVKNYRLAKKRWILNSFYYNDLPDEFKDKVKLMRAQCFALMGMHSHVTFYKEKHDLYHNPLLEPNLDSDALTGIFQRQFDLNRDSARKLAEFKRAERVANLNYITELQIEMELAISNFTAVDEVVDYYNTINRLLGMPNAYDITNIL